MTTFTLPPQPDWMPPGCFLRLWAAVTDQWQTSRQISVKCGLTPGQMPAYLRRFEAEGLVERRWRGEVSQWRRRQ